MCRFNTVQGGKLKARKEWWRTERRARGRWLYNKKRERVRAKQERKDKKKNKKDKKKNKEVKQLLKEQIAQRDVIDRMQGLIQDLVRVLKDNNIQIPAAIQHEEEKVEDPTNNPKDIDEILTEVEEDHTPEPEKLSQGDEGSEEEEGKTEPEEAPEEEVSEKDEKETAETLEAEAVEEEEREVDPIDERAVKKKQIRK